MAPSKRLRPARRRLLLGAVIALALPLTLACNSLIGLSDFEKGQCSGARCTDDGSFPDVVVEGGADVVQDVLPDVRGADPVSWAKWPMPNYDGGATLLLNQQNLSVIADYVKDNTTLLEWRGTLLPSEFTFDDIETECQKIPPLGGWRVPKRIELVTLLDYGRTRPFIDTTKFKAFPLVRVWTTSAVRPFVLGKPDQKYWVVNFDTGAVETLEANLPARVLCVRAK